MLDCLSLQVYLASVLYATPRTFQRTSCVFGCQKTNWHRGWTTPSNFAPSIIFATTLGYNALINRRSFKTSPGTGPDAVGRPALAWHALYRTPSGIPGSGELLHADQRDRPVQWFAPWRQPAHTHRVFGDATAYFRSSLVVPAMQHIPVWTSIGQTSAADETPTFTRALM